MKTFRVYSKDIATDNSKVQNIMSPGQKKKILKTFLFILLYIAEILLF
jgi:hypothetical protein